MAAPPSAVEIAERVLRQNWLEGERDGLGFAYTQPSPGRYPWQWYWDSCFAAIVWRRFEAGRSRAELESLLAAQRQDGFIGHTIFWDRPVSLTRLPFYNVLATAPSRPRRSSRRCSPGPGGSRSATRPRSRGSAPRPTGSRQPRPRGRRAALDRPARRVGPRRLAQVRPDLGPAGQLADRLPAAGPPQPPARLRRPPHPRARRPGALRGPRQHALVALAAGDGPPSATPALVERLWDERRGAFFDEAQPGGRGRGS